MPRLRSTETAQPKPRRIGRRFTGEDARYAASNPKSAVAHSAKPATINVNRTAVLSINVFHSAPMIILLPSFVVH